MMMTLVISSYVRMFSWSDVLRDQCVILCVMFDDLDNMLIEIKTCDCWIFRKEVDICTYYMCVSGHPPPPRSPPRQFALRSVICLGRLSCNRAGITEPRGE